MAKNLEKVIERLLENSRNTVVSFELLSALSYHNDENSSEFDYCLNEIKQNLNTEAVILNNLDLIELYTICKLILAYDDGSVAFNQTLESIYERIQELKNDGAHADEEEMEDDGFEEIENDPEEFAPATYLHEPDISSHDELIFINFINILVLKTMRKRIKEIPTDNKNDYYYKQNLLRHFNIFKYIILSQNNGLKHLGLEFRFNVDIIPYLETPDVDLATTAYNHCITILDKLYNPPSSEDNYNDTSISLFNMMCLEAYLNYVNPKDLINLSILCDNLKKESANRYYGNIAHNKILAKSKN